MYIKPIAGTKVLCFGVTKDKISIFVIKKFTHIYLCSLSHNLSHKQILTFCESVFLVTCKSLQIVENHHKYQLKKTPQVGKFSY